MRTCLLFLLVVVAALATLLAIASGFPAASSAVFLIGTPIVVIGAGLGAKVVNEMRKRRRSHER